MKANKTLRGQNHKRFKTHWTKWYTKGGAQSYLLTMITSDYQAKLTKKGMLRGLEWFIEEPKPLSQK